VIRFPEPMASRNAQVLDRQQFASGYVFLPLRAVLADEPCFPQALTGSAGCPREPIGPALRVPSPAPESAARTRATDFVADGRGDARPLPCPALVADRFRIDIDRTQILTALVLLGWPAGADTFPAERRSEVA
jgi:hypothetical protein